MIDDDDNEDAVCRDDDTSCDGSISVLDDDANDDAVSVDDEA